MPWTEVLPLFELPASPQRVDELPSPAPGRVEAFRVQAPAGRFVLIRSQAPLLLAFEATLFDLLAESRFPAPRPRRAVGGSLIAQLPSGGAAACYAIPSGEELLPEAVTQPQLLEAGRVLGRLQSLGEVHPAKVEDGVDGAGLLARVPAGPERDALTTALMAEQPRLPSGAIHGGIRPSRLLYIGDRCSAVMPAGLACFGPLSLDLAEAALGFMAVAPRPLAVLRAVLSGYQSMRRLLPEEVSGLPVVLRFAAAREGARLAASGRAGALGALQAVEGLSEAEILGVAGG
jgi:homoserine kinase type II